MPNWPATQLKLSSLSAKSFLANASFCLVLGSEEVKLADAAGGESGASGGAEGAGAGTGGAGTVSAAEAVVGSPGVAPAAFD